MVRARESERSLPLPACGLSGPAGPHSGILLIVMDLRLVAEFWIEL
jgi:hypothetical protein